MKSLTTLAVMACMMLGSCTPTPPEPPKKFPEEKLRNWNDWVDPNRGTVDTVRYGTGN